MLKDLHPSELNPKQTGVQLQVIGTIPHQANPGDAGYDLKAAIASHITLGPNETALIPTGTAIHIKDPNIVGLIFPRSGLGAKHGIILGNATGVLDSNFQGEIMVSLWNRSEEPYTVAPKQRIAQIVFTLVIHPTFEGVYMFEEESERGAKGFGSSDAR